MNNEENSPGSDELVFVSARGSDGYYWVPLEPEKPTTLARALVDVLWALLGFLFRLSLRILAIVAVVAFYGAVFFAALLVFAVLFSLG